MVSEGHHVASTKLNRYVFQPGITDVKSQVISMAPWIAANAGKKVTMIFPDFAFGYDHRDYLPPALKAQGADVIAQIAIPPTESSFTRYFPQIPAETDVIYHVMVGPAVLTFVKELGEFYGSNRPQLFGFMDSLEAVDINSPGLEFLDGSHFWEGSPRYLQDDASEGQKFYRDAVGIDANGAAVSDPKDISTASHMFGCWETLYVIKQAMEAAGYQGPADRTQAGRGDRGADRVRGRQGAPARRQDLQRQAAPGLRPPEHLQGRGRQAQGRAPHGDRGRALRAGRRLHDAGALGERNPSGVALYVAPRPAGHLPHRRGDGEGQRWRLTTRGKFRARAS